MKYTSSHLFTNESVERIADRMEPQKPHNDTLKEYIAQITREEDDRK